MTDPLEETLIRMAADYDAEISRWGNRTDKTKKLPFQVFRHKSARLVNPQVLASFSNQEIAVKALDRMSKIAAMAAVYRGLCGRAGGRAGGAERRGRGGETRAGTIAGRAER